MVVELLDAKGNPIQPTRPIAVAPAADIEMALARRAIEAVKASGFGDLGDGSIPMGYDPSIVDSGARGPFADKKYMYETYRRHSVVYSCVELIVQTASLDLPLYSEPDHPLVPHFETIFDNINEEQDLRALEAEIVRDLAIAGEGFGLKQRFTKNQAKSFPGSPTRTTMVKGMVSGLVRLIGEFTRTVPDKETGQPKHVEQHLEGTTKGRTYPLKDVVRWRIPHPSALYKGFSPIMALDLIVGTDLQAMMSYNKFFANGMYGNRFFNMKDGTIEQAQRNKEWLLNDYTQAHNHFKPVLLLGDIAPLNVGESMKDMPFLEGREFAIDYICAVYSVPRTKLFPDRRGGLGQAGQAVDDITFRADTIAPYQGLFTNGLNRQFLTEFDTRGLHLIPPPHQRIRYDRGAVAENATRSGWTGNEIRTIIWNLPPSDAPGMDEPLFLVRGVDLAADMAGSETVKPETPAEGAGSDDADLEPSPAKPLPVRVPPQMAAKASARRRRVAAKKAEPDDGEDDEEGDDTPEHNPRSKQRRAAALIDAATVTAGSALAHDIRLYASGIVNKLELKQRFETVQGGAIQHAAETGSRLLRTAPPPDAVLTREYTGPSVDRLLSIADRLANGEISDAQAEAWARAEAGEAWRVFNRERVGTDEDTWFEWVRDSGAASCEDCISLDGTVERGDRISEWPGEQQCGVNCRCEWVETDPPRGSRP